MTHIGFAMKPRAGVGELIEKYLDKQITYAELHMELYKLGHKTTNLYEMVRAAYARRAQS